MSEVLHFEDFPVGQTLDFGPYAPTDAEIRAYSERYDPLWARRLHRAQAGSRPAVAPWQYCAILMRMNFDGWMVRTAAQGAPGIDEVRWIKPVFAGDRLTGRYTVLDARASRSKPNLGLVQFRYEILDPAGEPVFSQKNFVMLARRTARGAAREPDAASASPKPRGSTDDQRGQRTAAIPLGAAEFTAGDMIGFARVYDPQPFHVDEAAGRAGLFGALAASGWQTAALWMRAYADTLLAGRAPLPIPERFLSVENLHWRRPVLAGDRITFDFTPIEVVKSAAGETILKSRNGGTDRNGVRVYDFTARMAVADKD